MHLMIADTAHVDPRAKLGPGAEIGPFCVVGPRVVIGANTRLSSHVCVNGRVKLGEACVLKPFCVIGESGPLPNSDSEHFDVEIGNHSVLEAGSRVEGGDHTRQGPTLLGAHVLIHGGAHLGPGCTVGDQAILSPGVILDAGVRLETAVTLGAGVYVRGGRSIGTHARVASLSCVFRDVPPFVVVAGRPARVRGLHLSALKHIGAAEPEIAALREAVRLLFRSKLSPDHAADRLAEHHLASPRVQQLLSFVRTHDLAIRPSTRSLRTSRSHP